MADSEQSSKMKEEFEASAKQHFPGWSVVQPNYFQRLPNGDYADEDVEVEWWFWQSAHDAGWLARGKQGEWISVETELPPRHQDVLCLNRDGDVFTGRICAGMHKPFFTYPRGFGSPSNTAPDWIDVTHWRMPLPAAPTETGKEQG